MVESLLHTQKEVSICQNDLLQIKGQLEVQEVQLKEQITQGVLTSADIMEKRRQVEIMRSAYRNCEEQIAMHQEKKEQILFNFDNKVVMDRNSLTSY